MYSNYICTRYRCYTKYEKDLDMTNLQIPFPTGSHGVKSGQVMVLPQNWNHQTSLAPIDVLDAQNPIPSGNLLHSYWTWHIEIVDLPIEDGDFPVRYVNVYQRVFHGEIGEIISMSSWDLITMFAGEPLNRLADDTSTKFSYWITFVVLSSKHRFHIITGWWF